MINLLNRALLAWIIVASSHVNAESYDFKLGLWETTSTTKILEIDAAPDIEKKIRAVSNIPKNTERECIKSIDSLFDPEPDDTEQCKWQMKRVSANEIAIAGACSGQDGSSKGVGEMHLNGKTFTSWYEITSTEGDIKMKIKVVANGEYIGACK